MSPISSMVSSVDIQSGLIKAGMSTDMSSPKVAAQDKTNTKSTSSSAPSKDDAKQNKMFDRVLSDAAPARAQESKRTSTKTKADSVDQSTASESEEPPSPNIGLLMSLLPALPQTSSSATADSPVAALAAQNASSAASPISPDTTNSMPVASATTAAMPNVQFLLPGVLKTPDLDTAAAESPTALIAKTLSTLSDKNPAKTDQFGTALASIESTTPVPFISGPLQQSAIVTAGAMADPGSPSSGVSELPVTHNEWPTALGHSLLWTIGEGIQKAEINVTPQDMGPINVHIRIENDKADISFTAAHAVTREALETSIPRLRDMLSQQGLNLTQAQVFSQASYDARGNHPHPNQTNQTARTSDAVETQEPEQSRPIRWRQGLVDDYA